MVTEGAHLVYEKVEGKSLLQKKLGKALAKTDATGKSMTQRSPSMSDSVCLMERALGPC